jgi:hypothetical protein
MAALCARPCERVALWIGSAKQLFRRSQKNAQKHRKCGGELDSCETFFVGSLLLRQ